VSATAQVSRIQQYQRYEVDRAIVHLIGGVVGYWNYHISTCPCANFQANEIDQPGVTEKVLAVSSMFVDNLSESILKTAVSLLPQAS
jgi:hypothetical protein